MSDFLHGHSWGSLSSRRRWGVKKRGAGVARFLLPVLVVMVLWVIWVTRDNYSMESFISRDRAYEAYIQNVVRRRRDVFESNVWRLLPVESGAGSTVEKISGELPIPEWLPGRVPQKGEPGENAFIC